VRFVDFVATVLKVPLTPAQRVLGLVAFDRVEPEALSGKERALAYQLFGPVETIPPAARSVLVAVLGARSGKSYIFIALYSLWRAIFADLSTLAPGELAVALVVAPDLRLARQALRYAIGAAESESLIEQWVASKSTDSFVLSRPDGKQVAIECLPATRGGSAVRGRSLVSACIDESGFFLPDEGGYVVNDKEIFSAVAPRVLPGGLVVVASTPWVEEGLLYELFSKNFGGPIDALAAHGPTLVMLDSERNREAVRREQERNPDNCAREFGAEFIAGGASKFFDAELLQSTFVDDVVRILAPTPSARSHIGGDIGLVSDSTSFVAVHAKSVSSFFVADMVELKPRKNAPLKLSNVVPLGCEFAHRHGDNVVWVDHHVLEPAREHLPNGFKLLPVPAGNAQKSARWLAVRQAMKEGKLRAPAEFVRLKAQLTDVYSKPLPGGGLQILQRRTKGLAHGDVAAAFVLAVAAALRIGGPAPPRRGKVKQREYESAREMAF
jgi:hypothetical protein